MNLIESNVRDMVRFTTSTYPNLKKLGWAATRVFFVFCAGFSVTSVVGAFFLAPLFCYWFFGDYRFWKYLQFAVPMILYPYCLFYLFLRGRSIPSFSWTAPPMSRPDLSSVRLNPEWPHGESCGDCSICCRAIRCPLLDKKKERCQSYGSFYWRYFNCGRYPATQKEIDLYKCQKWIMRA